MILGLGLGVPSTEQIFNGIFLEMIKEGNYLAIIGLVATLFVGVILILDSIAVAFGFKNLGNLMNYCEEDE